MQYVCFSPGGPTTMNRKISLDFERLMDVELAPGFDNGVQMEIRWGICT